MDLGYRADLKSQLFFYLHVTVFSRLYITYITYSIIKIFQYYPQSNNENKIKLLYGKYYVEYSYKMC